MNKQLTIFLVVLAAIMTPFSASASYLLIPMDGAQADHLRAYGIAYQAVADGVYVEWLLNYRGGSFLIESYSALPGLCIERGVSAEVITDPGPIYNVIEDNNMEAVPLEKAPRLALFAPEATEVWDDAVMRVLDYAEIPYERVYNAEVLAGDIYEYDWIHLHHEDFSGQYGKFYASFSGTPWYEADVARMKVEAYNAGYSSVKDYLCAVTKELREFVHRGGFIFAMCAATDSFDIALAAEGVDILDVAFDGDGPEYNYNAKLDFDATLAFEDFNCIPNQYTYEFSDIDSPRSTANVNPLLPGSFTLFEFSAKSDTIPAILTQCHTAIITEFMGQTTAFTRPTIKKNAVILATIDGYEEAKYLYGNFGEGAFVFYGGHDPEDFQHFIGEQPTDISLFPHSPGYRLILNNILFPAAQKEELKT